MNLQPAIVNPLPPHAGAVKAAAGATGSHAVATNADAPDAIDFATLLAQSLPAGTGLPTDGNATAAAAQEDKTAVPDQISADPAIAGDPAACQIAVQPEPPLISAASTAQTSLGATEQLHAALSVTNTIALHLPAAAAVAARPAAEFSASTASQADAPQLPAGVPLTAAHFAAAPSSAGASADTKMQAAASGADNAAIQPERGFQTLVAPVSSNTAPPAPLRLEIAMPLATPGWDQQLGQRVVWMSNQHGQIAELRINPPDLGPVEMRLTLDQGGQQASLQFSSPHAAVRETIENAMPRLREMMADAGIALGNTTVSGESLPRQATPDHNRPAPQVFAETPLHASVPGESSRTSARSGNGLVDTFA